jgi:hypothetical protein
MEPDAFVGCRDRDRNARAHPDAAPGPSDREAASRREANRKVATTLMAKIRVIFFSLSG